MAKNLVILSGGGLKVSYQLGVLQYMEENNIPINAIMGTSGGAINALIYANCGYNMLKSLWSDIAVSGNKGLFTSDLLDVNTLKVKWWNLINDVSPRIKFNLVTKKGRKKYLDELQTNLSNILSIANADPLRSKLKHNIDLDKFKIPFYCNFVDLESGEEVVVNNKDFDTSEGIINAVMASSSIPGFLPPVPVSVLTHETTFSRKTYYQCVDGGASSNVLISKAFGFIKEQPDPHEWNIIVINCDDGVPEIYNGVGVLNTVVRTVMGVMLNSLFVKDMKNTLNINKIVKDLGENNDYIYTDIKIIQPINNIGGFLDNSISLYSKRFGLGYFDALVKLKVSY